MLLKPLRFETRNPETTPSETPGTVGRPSLLTQYSQLASESEGENLATFSFSYSDKIVNEKYDKTDKQSRKMNKKELKQIHEEFIKDADFLLQFINEQGKILPRRITGNSLKYQRKVSEATGGL